MTLIGRKVLDAAIMNVRETVDEYGNRIISSDIEGQELKSFIGADYNSLYDVIKSLIAPKPQKGAEALSPSLLDWKIIMTDDERKQIIGINVITEAQFSNGRLSVVFNNKLKKNLIGLKKNFTMLDRSIVSQFTSNYSYQLYQIFKQTIDKELYRLNAIGIERRNNPIELNFDIVDLKVQLGVVEANENNILYKAITDNTVNTYDKISKIDDEEFVQRLGETRNFRRYAIERAKAEINELSDIMMDYEAVKRGRGGKTVGYKFFIQYKENDENEIYDSDGGFDIFELIDEVRDIITEPKLSSRDIKSILDAAEYNVAKVRNAYDILCMQDNVSNATGFLIKAIKEGYTEPKKRRNNSFNNFSNKRTYTPEEFKEMERQLLEN